MALQNGRDASIEQLAESDGDLSNGTMLQLAGFVEALLTGKPIDAGGNERLSL